MERTCRGCGLVQDVKLYPLAGKNKQTGQVWRRHLCMGCYGKQTRRFRQKNIRKLRDYKRSCSCAHCGYDDHRALEFHHVDSNKELNVAEAAGRWTWAKVLTEIEKCIVLCSNCHRIVHWNELNNGL